MTASVSTSSAGPRASSSPFVVGIALFATVAALVALGWTWRVENRSGEIEKERSEYQVMQRLLDERVKQLETDLRATQQRQQDAAAINRNLRDELLGVAERAELVEQALKRVSDRGMANVTELRMNNAEFLLGAGLARLRLFQDVAGAATAFSLADAELAALQDPVVTGIRQSLAAELAALSAYPADARSAALDRLQKMAAKVDQLELKHEEPEVAAPITDNSFSARARRLLGDFVRVRRVSGDVTEFSTPLNESLARVDLRLQLRYAEAALMKDDRVRFSNQLQLITAAAKSFDLETDAGRWILQELEALDALPEFPEFAEAGGALEQLRNLQGTHRLAKPFGGVE